MKVHGSKLIAYVRAIHCVHSPRYTLCIDDHTKLLSDIMCHDGGEREIVGNLAGWLLSIVVYNYVSVRSSIL